MASKNSDDKKPKKPATPIVQTFDGPVTIRGTKVIVGGQVVSHVGIGDEDDDD